MQGPPPALGLCEFPGSEHRGTQDWILFWSPLCTLYTQWSWVDLQPICMGIVTEPILGVLRVLCRWVKKFIGTSQADVRTRYQK